MSEGALPDWGSFCDEQAQKLSDCFKEELRQFRLKNPQYNDVPTAGFARLFTASFLTYFEESSSPNTVDNHNAAAASATLTPSTQPSRQRAWKSIFRKNKDGGDKDAGSEGSRPTRRRSNTISTNPVAHTSAATNNSATLAAGATIRGPTVEQQQSVATPVMSANMNMLQFNQSNDNFDNLNWCRCHVTLSLVHGMYQLLIRCPPKTAQPKMSLFCFLITSVRPTSHVEVPDCCSSFVVKAKGSVEYVFDAKSKEAMQSWVEAISRYAGIQSDNELISLSNNSVTSHNEMANGNSSRSPDSASRRGRQHMMEFTPLFVQGQQDGASSPAAPSRTHRSNSLGILDIPLSPRGSGVRRISDSSGQGRDSTLVTSLASSQRVPTPPNVPTTESQDNITSAVSPDPVLSTEHSVSTRSLNTSFIDGPPATDADDDSDASGDCSPRGSPTGGGSPLPSLEPGVDPDGLRQYPWFHGMISRIDAALLVTRHGNSGTGEYLIRQSESRAGDLVLSFNYHGRAKHLRLSISPNGTCRVQHLEFRNILHMLDHFKAHPIPLEAPGTTADIQLTDHLPVGTPVPNLPGVRMEPLGRTSSSASNLRSNTLSTDSFHTRSVSVRHNGRTNNSNGNVYVLT